MSQPDAELIARLLEGRASPEERRAILESADADPEILALLADSAALREATIARPMWQRMVPSRASAPLYAMAAVLVFAIVLPSMMRSRMGVPQFNTATLDAKAVVAGAFAGAQRQTPRGEGISLRLQMSAGIGARTTDLDVLIRTNDSTANLIVLELAAAARTIPGGAAAASQLQALVPGDARARRSAIDALGSLLDQQRFRAGKWAEALRLAAAANSEAFLRAPTSRSAFDAMARSEKLTPEIRQAAGRVAQALANRASSRDLEQAAVALLAELAR